MRHIVRVTLAGVLGTLTAGLVACGSSGSGLLSSDQSSQLNARLSQISSALSAGQCGQATHAAASFQNDVAQLPDSVSTTLRQNLIDGANTIAQLAPRSCTQTNTTPTTTTQTQTTTSTPTVTTTQTPTIVTTSTPPAPTTPAPTTPAPTTSNSGSGGGGLGPSGSSGTSGSGPPSGGAAPGSSGSSGSKK